MATDQLINKTQGDAIIAGLTAIKNAINDQPVPTQVENVVADAFDVGVSYVPGDYCIYENNLYICDVAHHGAWDGNDFTLTTVGAVLESVNSALSGNYLHNNTTSTQKYTCTLERPSTNPYGYTITEDGLYHLILLGGSNAGGNIKIGDMAIPVQKDSRVDIITPIKKNTSIYFYGSDATGHGYVILLT